MTITKDTRRLAASVAVAAVLWFIMFSPWTSASLDFWEMMSTSAVILSLLVVRGMGYNEFLKGLGHGLGAKNLCMQLALGVAMACALWGVFWIGDKLSQIMFDFARGQVDNVYGMKDGSDPYMIGLLLLMLIGPAEEMFWRGYVQRKMSDAMGATAAFIVTTLVYALVHIWSFNFMLVMAALVAGAAWGLLYRLKPEWLPALVVSHALWDAMVFVIFPI